MIFTITVGDHARAGHGSTDTFVIECSHTLMEVRRSYNKACEDFGYDPVSSLCYLMEDKTIPVDFAQKLAARGFRGSPGFSSFIESYEADGEVEMSTEDWARMLLFMAGTRLMDFSYSILYNNWDAGGYGLFEV